MIIIRNYQPKDANSLWQLKFNTIRTINQSDYLPEQTQAWAPDEYDAQAWQLRADEMQPFVAWLLDDAADNKTNSQIVNDDQGTIVGFADLQGDGYIDHFFCHADYQGHGIGKALMQHIFTQAKSQDITRLYSHVSITARPFFERFGFNVIKEQQVAVRGQILTNFVMERF